MADPASVTRVVQAIQARVYGGNTPEGGYTYNPQLEAAVNAALDAGLPESDIATLGGITAINTAVGIKQAQQQSANTPNTPGYVYNPTTGQVEARGYSNDSTSSGGSTTTGTSTSAAAPANPNDLVAKLKSVGYTDDMIAQMNPTEFANALKTWGFAPTGGAGNGLSAQDDVARANAQNILNNFNPATDLIPLPGMQGKYIIRGQGTIVDLSSGADFAPILGADGKPTGYLANAKTGQIFDPSGKQIAADTLAEQIRANKAGETQSAAQLAETQRANMANEALKGQDLAQQQANTIANLYANPGNFVQREYMVRGLTPPSGSLATNYQGPQAGGGISGAGTMSGSNVPTGGITPASGLAATTPQGTYPTLSQTLLNPQSNPNWGKATSVVNPETGTDPRLGATGSTRTPAQANALSGMLAQEWIATHPNENTLAAAQMGAKGLSTAPYQLGGQTWGMAGHQNYDPKHGWQFTPDNPNQGGQTFNQTTQQWSQAPQDTQPDVTGIQGAGWTPDVTSASGAQTAGDYTWDPNNAANSNLEVPKFATGGATLAKSFIAGDPQQGQTTGNPELVNINDPTHDATASVTPLNNQQQMSQGIPPDGQPATGGGLAKLMADILMEMGNRPQQGLAKYAYGTGYPDQMGSSMMEPQVSQPSLSGNLRDIVGNPAGADVTGEIGAGTNNYNFNPSGTEVGAGTNNYNFGLGNNTGSPTNWTGGTVGGGVSDITPTTKPAEMGLGTAVTQGPTSLGATQPGANYVWNSTTSQYELPGAQTPNPAQSLAGNTNPQAVANAYGFTPTSNADIQNLPSIQAIMQGYSQGRGLSQNPTFTAGFGTQLPEARGINYGGYLRARQDPLTYGLLSSLYNSGSRNLDAEASIARQFAPFGNAQQRIRT